MARFNRQYTDLDAMFAPHPLTGDLSYRKNEAAIKFAVKNLVLTQNYERPFDSSIGSNVKNFLFEQMDDLTIILLKQVIRDTIDAHEPRVLVSDVIITKKESTHEIVITIKFTIINTEEPLSITFALNRTR